MHLITMHHSGYAYEFIFSAMASNDIKVLGPQVSPYVNRVVMALKLKLINDYELIEINPHQKTEILVKNNPVYKKVPILIHAGRPICESLIIVEYIDETWTDGPSILPLDPYNRSLARFWAAYIDDKWYPLFRQLEQVKGEEAKRETMEKIKSGVALLEKAFVECSKGNGYFNGERLGYLDIALGSQLGWIGVTESVTRVKFLDPTITPNLVAWADRLYHTSCLKDVVLESDVLLEVFEKYRAAKAVSEAVRA